MIGRNKISTRHRWNQHLVGGVSIDMRRLPDLMTYNARTRAVVILAVCGLASVSPRAGSTTRRAAVSRTTPPLAGPRTDNLVALEMGGRVENQPARPGALGFVPERALDGDAKTMWAELFPPATIVLSFIGRDTALVASVSFASPNADSPPPYGVNLTAARPRAVEISLSTTSPTTGFVKAISAPLPDDDNEHVVKLPAPAEARFIKLTFPPPTPACVRKERHRRRRDRRARSRARGLYAALAAASGPAGAPLIGQAHAGCGESRVSSTRRRERPVVRGAVRRGRGVSREQVRAGRCHGAVAVLRRCNAFADPGWSPPTTRYFGPGPGKGLVDESIYKRLNYWLLQPDLLRPADLVPSGHVDTVVLEQVCDIKTSVRADVKQALVAWVANGNKLIISDADSCGPGQVPDYSFLPYRFATSNPGGRAAASALQIVEQNFLVSPDSHDPAFFDEPSWRLKKNGNMSNDFGDSNTVIRYDDHWCGALFGTNAIGGSGFVMAYAHYGRGVILYDGIDRDQSANLAYQQYVARQLLLPFRPDPLPCSLRVAPFAITTDVELVERHVTAGETVTYPLTVLAAKPDYAGTVALSVAAPAGAPGFAGHIDPATVTLGAKGGGDAHAEGARPDHEADRVCRQRHRGGCDRHLVSDH